MAVCVGTVAEIRHSSCGLISYAFGLTSTCFALDAGSTQLVGIHLVQAEMAKNDGGEAVVLCADILKLAYDVSFAIQGWLSAHGRCHTFDV